MRVLLLKVSTETGIGIDFPTLANAQQVQSMHIYQTVWLFTGARVTCEAPAGPATV
jgi:hypothetical protein